MLWLAVATGASVALALLSWHVVEKQFLKLKTLFPYQYERTGTGGLPFTSRPLPTITPTPS